MKDSKQNYIDGYLKRNLDILLKEAIPNDWDFLALYIGPEGTGKSTLALQNAYYCDRNLNIDKVVFSPEQFDTALDKSKKGSSIVWDEAITGANAQLYAFMISIKIISKLTQIRKKNLKIFICFPYLHLLNDYFVKRATYGTYVRAKSFKDRGYFNFYSLPRLEFLYQLMKEKFRYNNKMALSHVTPNFYGRFTSFFPINKQEYEEKKESSRKNSKHQQEVWRERFIQVLEICRRESKYPMTNVAKELGVSTQFLYKILKDKQDKQTT